MGFKCLVERLKCGSGFWLWMFPVDSGCLMSCEEWSIAGELVGVRLIPEALSTMCNT